MPELRLSKKTNKLLDEFIENLNNIYKEDLISIILYGSAASGEFVDRHSNINLLVILKNIGLDNLSKAAGLLDQSRYKLFSPLFFSQDYIAASCDVFPIEFSDMKENYIVLCGKDILKDMYIDFKNLRFQCEHELKAKLISLRHSFLRLINKNNPLRETLLKSFTSVVHILRNVIRLKGKKPHYLKQDFLRQIKEELPIDLNNWERILELKNKPVSLNNAELKSLFSGFVEDLEKIVAIVDKL